MKKIIFGLLSFLLITPVFAEDIYPSWAGSSSISFESLSQNSNIFYSLKYNSDPYYFGYFDSNNTYQILNSFPSSLDVLDNGGSIDESNIGLINQFGSSFISGQGGSNRQGNGLLSFSLSGGLPVLGSNVLYLQSKSGYTGYNGLIAFGSNYVDPYSASTLSNSYVRYFYSAGLGFTGLTPTYSGFFINPVGVQIFGSSLYVLTNKGRVFDYAGFKSLSRNWIIPGYLDGYSYTVGQGSGLKFFSVLPGFTSFITGVNYYLPSYLETSNFLMFKVDGLAYNGSYNKIGVLQIYNTGYKYSVYSCDGLSLTDYGSGIYKYNFDSACIWLDGGYITGDVVYDRGCGYVYLSYLLGRQSNGGNTSTLCNGGSYYGLLGSLSIKNSFLNVSFPIKGYQNRVNFSFPLVSDSSVDILSNFDNTAVPPEPLTTGKVEELLDIYCNQLHLINPALCNNNGGPSIGSGAYTYEPVLSGDQVVLVITDYSDTNDYIIHTGEDGEIWIECVGDWCPIYNNTGSSDIGSVGGSGFILDTGYYENFFNKTGYFAKCPYPYTDLQIGEKLKIVQKIKNSIGDFDIFLPINCSIAAFTAWKTYKFLSDVDMGLNPLMGNIQNSEDPRVYLYKFFDFLMSFALIVFLLKIYHLLN